MEIQKDFRGPIDECAGELVRICILRICLEMRIGNVENARKAMKILRDVIALVKN